MVLFLNCDFFFFAFSFIHTFPSFFLFLFSLAFCQPHTYTHMSTSSPFFFLYFHLIPEAPHSFFLQLSEVFLLYFFFFYRLLFFFLSAPHSFFFLLSASIFFFSRSSSLFLFFSLFLSPTLFSSIGFYQGSYWLLFFFLVLD